VADHPWLNKLWYGDNLELLEKLLPDESVDLVYLDPPFNSNRNYNVIFGSKPGDGNGAAAQIQAFDDTWHWTPVTEQQYDEYTGGRLPNQIEDALMAFRQLLGENDAMAYLVNMAPRLVELRRVLKRTGSLYLHCDPTMSHYLKVLLDAVFGAEYFRNEVIWKRHNARSVKQAIWPRLHDVLLYYGRTSGVVFIETKMPSGAMADPHDIVTWADGKRYRTKDLTAPETRQGETGQPWHGVNPTAAGRHWRVGHATLNELDAAGLLYWQKNGMPRERAKEPYIPAERMAVVGDVWSDIDSINAGATERLGYPTQKPLALLERIITASSNEGDVVLDPFCGCGTTIDAAQRLGRRWIGIDVTFIAVDLIANRLRTRFPGIDGSYETYGIPKDMGAAHDMFKRDRFEFERWAVSLVKAQPNEKQVQDKGVDGVARFVIDTKTKGRVLVSVKGGKDRAPMHVRELGGTVKSRKAEMGVLVTLEEPTPGMHEEADHGGNYTWPVNGQVFPRIQIITIKELLAGKHPQTPPLNNPYLEATKAGVISAQLGFDELSDDGELGRIILPAALSV
jgi:DNA modification methylase